MANPIPDWKLERLAQGELPKDELEALQAQVAHDPELQRRLAALREDDAALLAAQPPAQVARLIAARASVQSRRRHLRLVLPLVPVLVAAAWLLTVAEPQGDARQSVLETTRAKGLVPHLVVHRKRGVEAEVLADGAPARPGDVLQLSYVAAGRAHGVVVSIDGRGTVTLHHPQSARGPTLLEREAEVALPTAYELDDAPDFERFFFVTAEQPLDVGAIVAAAAELARTGASARSAPLPLANAAEQISALIRKVPR